MTVIHTQRLSDLSPEVIRAVKRVYSPTPAVITKPGIPLERERWDVSSFNRKGTAHWWIDSPMNPEYVRSLCGLVESKSNLQGLVHELCRCDRCRRGKLSAELTQTKRDVAQVKSLRALGACNREIAEALGIAEDSPLLAR